jgi:hypothetical protein
MISVAIMQPTYLPWIGYFGLIDHVDEFIFLDTVQFSKRSWQQRNQIKTSAGATWLSVPVHSKGVRDQTVKNVSIVYDGSYPSKHIRAIEIAYSKTPYFSQYANELFAILTRTYSQLAELTIDLIDWFCDILGISTPLKRSSELDVQGSKADLLADICRVFDADLYISPPGSKDYMDESDAFEKLGISVSYFNFIHPEYYQIGSDYLPYMSVIDLLFNMGSKSLEVIRSGYKVN